MTDQIPADKVRVVRDIHLEEAKLVSITDAEREIHQRVADAMEALLPTPPPPTLADMTADERAGCQWMQADVKGYESRVVIVNTYWKDGSARAMWPNARMGAVPWRSITPRPDLPRMEWPGEKKPTPAPALPDGWRLAEHPVCGRVIVTAPASDRNGHVYVVRPTPAARGYDWLFCPTDRLTYLNGDGEPANTVKVGDLIQSADDLRVVTLTINRKETKNEQP